MKVTRIGSEVILEQECGEEIDNFLQLSRLHGNIAIIFSREVEVDTLACIGEQERSNGEN